MRDELLEKIRKQFDIHIYDYIDEGIIDLRFNASDCNLEVSIILYDESICMVQHEEYIWNDMDKEYRYCDIYFSCMILQQLWKVSNIPPIVEVSKEGKEYRITIGYQMKELKIDDTMKCLRFFSEIKIYDEKINEVFLEHEYPELYRVYKELHNEKEKVYKRFMIGDWSSENHFKNITEYKNIHDYHFVEQDNVFINLQGNIIVGFTEKSFDTICSYYTVEEQPLDNLYFGIKYCVADILGKTKIWSMSLIKDAIHIIEYLVLNHGFPIRYYYSSELLIIHYMDLWVCIKECTNGNMNQVIEEKNMLQSFYRDISKYIPIEYKNIDYDFSKLNEQDFEKLCCELLIAKGFKNVICRGKTNAPDNGVDIEADEEYDTLLEHKSRHWIFQCKHMKKTVDRRDICEIPFLLKEFHAEGYGIFYTNLFKPNTIDRFKTISKEEIYICDINEINNLLNSYTTIAQKYFGLG